MKVVLVGSNPTAKNLDPKIPFVGTSSGKILTRWLQVLGIDPLHARFVNVSDQIVLGNRKLKVSEYDLDRLENDLVLNLVLDHLSNKPLKVVALGKTASDALMRIRVDHFELPHPSGLNRKLNDTAFVATQLKRCADYLQG